MDSFKVSIIKAEYAKEMFLEGILQLGIMVWSTNHAMSLVSDDLLRVLQIWEVAFYPQDFFTLCFFMILSRPSWQLVVLPWKQQVFTLCFETVLVQLFVWITQQSTNFMFRRIFVETCQMWFWITFDETFSC